MMEFMVEMVITAFAFGGIIGAIVALHLSANLKETNTSRDAKPVSLELPSNDESTELKHIPVDINSRRAAGERRRR